ncbi:MAG: hypothetical protein IPJ19_03060 [Planctomycetes bacterium]|nr:hypothetical protein [Planctomycetota bacterium]
MGRARSIARAAAIAAALGCCFSLPVACEASTEDRSASIEALIDSSLSTGSGDKFGVAADPSGGWHADRVVPSTPILMERTELWLVQDSSGLHARARVSRYEESEAVSGVVRDEVAGLHGLVRVSAVGLPGEGETRVVAYVLDGQRAGEPIQRAGSFEFRASDVRH